MMNSQNERDCWLGPWICLIASLVTSTALPSGCKRSPNPGPATTEPRPRPETDGFVDSLTRAGFYDFAINAQAADKARDSASQTQSLFPPDIRRSCPIDSQKIAWAGGKDFLDQCAAMFELRGVHFNDVSQMTIVTLGYYVYVNNEEFMIYEEYEYAQPNIKDLSVKRVLEMANKLLDSAGSPDHMYFIDAGEGAQLAVFLTPLQFQLLRESSLPDPQKPLSSEMLPRS